jgi:deazaflavin-dependent oxidoreductase (nitroreductase family)
MDVPAPIRPVIRKVIDLVGALVYRRGGRVQGRPLLRLITTGAKTGARRVRLLGWFPDHVSADSWIVVASNGGSARHPDWAYNLAAHPNSVWVDLGDGEVPVRAEILNEPERKAAWTEIASAAPGYGRYQEQTDREIPVFRLTPRPSPDTG